MTPILAVIVAVAFFMITGRIGGMIYERDPAYWFNEIYGWDIQEHPESELKVKMQTGLRFAVPAAIAGFLIGWLLPWIRYWWYHLETSDEPKNGG